MANLLDFGLHWRWAEKLIEARMTVQHQTHSQVSFSQLESADRKLFLELADRTRDGVQSGAAGRPLDVVFEDTCNLPELMHLMQPLPIATGKVQPPPKPRFRPYDRPSKGGKKGDLICFGYGLKSCTEQVKNGRCSRGFHVCAVPKGGLAHPALDCPRYASLKKGGS